MKIRKPVKKVKKTTTLRVRELSGSSDSADLQRQLQEALTANAQLVKRNKKLRNGGSVPPVVIKPVGKKSDKKLKEAEDRIAALEERERRAKLKRIRQRLIDEYGGQVVPELIFGETKAELVAAAAQAHKVWKKTLKNAGALDDDDEDDDTEEDDEDLEDDEDSEDDDLDTDEDEDDDLDDDDSDEDEVVQTRRTQKRPVAPVARGTNGNNRAPVTSRKPTARVPVVPVAADRRGGVRRGNDPASALRGVKTYTPAEYREKRSSILGNMAVLYPNEK